MLPGSGSQPCKDGLADLAKFVGARAVAAPAQADLARAGAIAERPRDQRAALQDADLDGELGTRVCRLVAAKVVFGFLAALCSSGNAWLCRQCSGSSSISRRAAMSRELTASDLASGSSALQAKR